MGWHDDLELADIKHAVLSWESSSIGNLEGVDELTRDMVSDHEDEDHEDNHD